MLWLSHRRHLPWFLLLGMLRLQAQTPPPPTETLRGQLGIYIEDRFEQHFTATHYTLQTSSGNIELTFPSPRDAEGLTPGSDIEVTGHRHGSRFIVADDVAAMSAAISRPGLKALRRADLRPRDTAVGQRKIAIILINYLNQTTQPISSAQATAMLQTVNQYYQEASYQQYSVTGDVYGYLNLPVNESCAQLGDTASTSSPFVTLTNAGIQAAENAGVNLSSYQSYVFIGPTATNCMAGVATIGGSPGLILIRFNEFNSVWNTGLIHELGHNLGLYHSHSYSCNSAIYNPGVNCGLIEYD